MKALINIDYTNDFVAADGALTCGEPGQKIENAIVEITKHFINNADYVVFAVDYHERNDPYHPETKLFPPHNIEDGLGRMLYGKLFDVYIKNMYNLSIHWIDKTRYSAFVGTDLELRLRERGITEIHVVGVCTDICVLHTVIDAYNKGFSVVVHKDAVASFNQAGHNWALEHFEKALGVKVV